ncbi:MAG: ketopantoate reductase family protein [Spongiibacter marinus]|uniref:ketopantoate reductase family protein n=1 Tax=Spongiibacter marinus TaxID=354246 RepID=UPI003C667C1F
MRWLIIGAGGIGGYYAARLAEAGEDVTVSARGEHLQAIQRAGLIVRWEGGELHPPVVAVDQQSLVAGYAADDFDIVVLAVKAGATASVMTTLNHWLSAAEVPVLSLQNGVDNEPIIARHLGNERTLGGLAIKIGGHIVSPGVIQAEGEARVVMGCWPSAKGATERRLVLLKKMKGVFDAANIPAEISEDIQYSLWRKLIINNGVNPLSALTGLDTRTLTHQPDYKRIVLGMMNEVVVAAAADHVALTATDLDDMFEVISQFNAIKTSMLVDAEKQRPLEVAAICGAVVARCRALGHEPAYTATVMALLDGRRGAAG